MANLTYSVYIHTKTISLDKTFTYSVLKKKGKKNKWRKQKKIYNNEFNEIYVKYAIIIIKAWENNTSQLY